MSFQRGDLATAVLPGAFGKPRPVLIIQSDLFAEHPTVTVLPLTSHLTETPLFRYTLTQDVSGLDRPSQVMVDKLMTIPREKLGQRIGHLGNRHIKAIDRLLLVFLGIAR